MGRFPAAGPTVPPGYDSVMTWQERITVDPSVRGGEPCVKGTRITAVYDVLEYRAGGMSEDAILADSSDLARRALGPGLVHPRISFQRPRSGAPVSLPRRSSHDSM